MENEGSFPSSLTLSTWNSAGTRELFLSMTSFWAIFPTRRVSKSNFSWLIVRKGYFPMALSLRIFVPSSAPENLKTTVATITFASSGVKVKVSSYFWRGPKAPRESSVNKLLNKTWKWSLTRHGRYGEGALICLDFVSYYSTQKTWILDCEGTSSSLVDTAIPEINTLWRYCVCNCCWSRLYLRLARVITHS